MGAAHQVAGHHVSLHQVAGHQVGQGIHAQVGPQTAPDPAVGYRVAAYRAGRRVPAECTEGCRAGGR